MTKIFNHIKESNYYRKNKVCCSCKNFIWFYGSAGFCKYGPPGPSGMIDCMDSCTLMPSEYKYDIIANIKSLKTLFLFYYYDIKYKFKSFNKHKQRKENLNIKTLTFFEEDD